MKTFFQYAYGLLAEVLFAGVIILIGFAISLLAL